MYKVIFYEDENGKSETFEYFKAIALSNQKQDAAVYKKMRHQINMLKSLGPLVHSPQSKKLKGYKFPLWELRPLPERVFYGLWHGDTFILLNHYTKKSNETDPRQIERAISLLDSWYERNGR